VVRAALMGALALFARQIGRQHDGLNSLGQGARLEVLAASRSGAVLLLEWRNFRTSLPVGLDEDLCQSLLEEPGLLPVNALLLASSGAADLNPPEWLPAWGPQVVLLSVGSGDRRARPASETLAAVEGYTLLRTDGERIWVEVEINQVNHTRSIEMRLYI
jgi:hypothetical protein